MPQKGGRSPGVLARALNINMKVRSVRRYAALLFALLMLLFAQLAAADVNAIRVSSLSEPQSVVSEQDVNVTIKIYNSSLEDLTGELTLFNPQANSVEKYSGLKGEQSVTYTGVWHVTAEQIAQGRITYFFRYIDDPANAAEGEGEVRAIPVTIQAMEGMPQLTASYTVTPMSAREGQTVDVVYTLANTGNVELRGINIENPGVSASNQSVASLSVGERVTVEDHFTMGKTEVVSTPVITYQQAGETKRLTVSDLTKKTITVAEDGLEAKLSCDAEKAVYPGDEVTLKLEIKNTGNTAYSGLTAQLDDGTVLCSDVELAPGANYTGTTSITMVASREFNAMVSGKDSTGAPVSVAAAPVSVETEDAENALVLRILAAVNQTVIYEEPALLRFAVEVANIGLTDAENLIVKEAGTTVAKIESLPAGESRTLVFDLKTSIAGKFAFTVTGKDKQDVEIVYDSNVLQVDYLEPTPAPTAAPTPTPVPPTPSPAPTPTAEPTLVDVIREKVDPTVLYACAGVLGALIVILLIVSGVKSAHRRKVEKNALDSFERVNDTRNYNGRRKTKAKARKADKKPEEEQPIVNVPELTDEPEKASEQPAAPVVPAAPKQPEAPKADEQPKTERKRAPRRQQVVQMDKETLRVAPVDERPEFVAQGKVNDSATRIFAKAEMPEEAPEEKKEKPANPFEKVAPPETVSVPKTSAPANPFETDKDAQSADAAATVRFTREQMDELSAKLGKTRKEIKPMKKKKGFPLFGKKHEDDDFIDDDYDDGDDDFIE